MKILLVGNGSRQNRGCEAIGITTVELLKRYFPYAEITILSFEPESDKYFERFGAKVFGIRNSDERPNIILRGLNKFKLVAKRNKAKMLGISPYVEKLAESDLVLSLGGDNYSEDYGIPSFFWDLGILARQFKVPFVIWAGSVGPFNSKKGKEIAVKGLKSVSMVTARENITVDYLKKIGYGGEIVRVFDSAFMLEKKEIPLPKFKRNYDTIGFNISPIYYRYTSKNSDEVIEIVGTFLEKVAGRHNILLIPHVMSNKDINNDAIYMRCLSERLDNVVMADANYDSMELKYLISKCSLFIGARTHATIAALSEGIPTLSLGYSIKAKGLNEDIFGSDEFLLESGDFNLKNLYDKFNHLIQNMEKARETLLQKKFLIEKMVSRGAESLKNVL